MTSAQPSKLADLTDAQLVEIWFAAVDPEHPTPRELEALALMEERNVDF